jgi:hypothetical protein
MTHLFTNCAVAVAFYAPTTVPEVMFLFSTCTCAPDDECSVAAPSLPQ